MSEIKGLFTFEEPTYTVNAKGAEANVVIDVVPGQTIYAPSDGFFFSQPGVVPPVYVIATAGNAGYSILGISPTVDKGEVKKGVPIGTAKGKTIKASFMELKNGKLIAKNPFTMQEISSTSIEKLKSDIDKQAKRNIIIIGVSGVALGVALWALWPRKKE